MDDARNGNTPRMPIITLSFVIVMTVLFHDIHASDNVGTERQRMPDEVLDADDTICMATVNAAMNRVLAAIETEGA